MSRDAGVRVIVAVEAEALRERCLAVVRGLGLEAVGVADGERAHALLVATPRPAGLVVDVGLPGRAAWQLVDDARAAGAAPRLAVVLVTSAYSPTAYKRRPTSLHGADDYVEAAEVGERLGDKLVALLGDPRARLSTKMERPGP